MISEALAVQGAVLIFPTIIFLMYFSFEGKKARALGVIGGIALFLCVASFIASGWFAAAGV